MKQGTVSCFNNGHLWGYDDKQAKFFLFSEESKCKKLINKGVAFICIVLGINAYLLLTIIVLPALRIPVTMPVKLIFGIIVAAVVIIASYRYYELPKGVTLYNDYMQFDVHGVPDSRHREKSNPKVPYACIQKIQICKGKRPPKSIFNSKDDGWFDMGGSGERYIRITAEIYEEEIFVFYEDDPEAFVEALRDYMINAGATKIWGV